MNLHHTSIDFHPLQGALIVFALFFSAMAESAAFHSNFQNDMMSFFSNASQNYCESDRNCGDHSVCHLAKCKCYLGYLWSNVTSKCERVNCSDDDLRCIDMPFTWCRMDSCICQEDYYLDWNSQTCKFSYISNLQTIERSVPIVVVFVALILLSSAIARCYYLRRRRLTPSDELTAPQPSNNLFAFYDQIIVNDTRNYPPPPPYTIEYGPKEEEFSHYSSPPPPYSV